MDNWRCWAAFGAAIGLALLACAARSDAGAFVIVSDLAVLLVMRRSDVPRVRRRSVAALVAASLVVAGFVFLRTAQASQSASGDMVGGTLVHTGVSLSTVIYNLMYVVQLLFGAVGFAGLGWLDTALPEVVGISATLLIGMVWYVGFVRAPWRVVTGWLAVAAAAVAIPVIVWSVNGTIFGYLVQPRYMLPLLPMVIGLPLFRYYGDRPMLVTELLRWSWWSICLFVYSAALWANIDRYARGQGSRPRNFDLSVGAKWWPTSVVSPMETWAIGSVAAALGLLLAMRFLMPRAPLFGREQLHGSGSWRRLLSRIRGSELPTAGDAPS